MAREGIYIDGKEIVARYVGDKLVWQKETDKLFLTPTYSTKWSNYFSNSLMAETKETDASTWTFTPEDSIVDITRIIVDDRVWKAKTWIHHFRYAGSNRYYMDTRIIFHNKQDKEDFIRFANSQSSIEIKVYMEKI